mmetsp:Transcript_48650/g.135975  ORF Transcript_48650/g.135975 Transcript_48650/m.135975 type:complete len:211 (+) Transcript_48650:810-1442(+)
MAQSTPIAPHGAAALRHLLLAGLLHALPWAAAQEEATHEESVRGKAGDLGNESDVDSIRAENAPHQGPQRVACPARAAQPRGEHVAPRRRRRRQITSPRNDAQGCRRTDAEGTGHQQRKVKQGHRRQATRRPDDADDRAQELRGVGPIAAGEGASGVVPEEEAQVPAREHSANGADAVVQVLQDVVRHDHEGYGLGGVAQERGQVQGAHE